MNVSFSNATLDQEKGCVLTSNATLDQEKSCVSTSNVTLGQEKSCVSNSNATYSDGKGFVSIEKVSFEGILIHMEVKERTKGNIRLLKRALTDDIFTRTDISKLLRISGTAAGNLINKMKDKGLIVPISGHGKGKYRFITEEDETV